MRLSIFLKSILFSILFLIADYQSVAQSPESMNYQAVIRDGSGNVLSGQAVSLRIKILQGSASGSSVYIETFTPSTNAYGSIAIQIGTGTVITGTFNTIDWGGNTHFVETAVDISGGTNYTVISTTQLMSVPYALYAKNAGLDSTAIQAMIDASGGTIGGSGKSIKYPVGFSGTPLTFDLSTGNYTVPTGKTLYILDYIAYSGDLSINSINIYSGYHNAPNNGSSMHFKQPLILDAGDILSGPGHVNGLLINQTITSVTHSLVSGDYTVPAGKVLYIMDFYGANSNDGIFIDGLIMFNGYHNFTNLGNSRHLAQPLVSSAGQVINGSHNFNGYLVDTDYFQSSSSSGNSSSGSDANTLIYTSGGF